MKKLLSLLLAATLSASLLAGCGSSTTESSTTSSSSSSSSAAATETTTQATLSGSVTVGGSTSVESVILSAIEVFCEANPDVTITYDPTGSSTGVKSAASGDYDIGLASRDVKDSETEEYQTVGTVFAIDGIAIIVNNDNAVSDLTVEDVAAIAAGEVTNWADLGGDDSPIVLIGREAGSGTRDGFESIVGVEDCVYEQELSSTGGVIGAVQQNVYAIGYASVASVSDSVKALTIEGVEANEGNIQDGSYKFQRNFNFVTVDGVALSDAAQAFYDFVLSSDASELISNAGAVPTV